MAVDKLHFRCLYKKTLKTFLLQNGLFTNTTWKIFEYKKGTPWSLLPGKLRPLEAQGAWWRKYACLRTSKDQKFIVTRTSLTNNCFFPTPRRLRGSIATLNVTGWTSLGSFGMNHKYIHSYRVVFLTGPPDFQYQNEKQVAANQD